MSVGIYIGFATVGIFIYWFCFYDWSGYDQQLVTFDQLRDWSECQDWENFTVKPFLHYNFDNDPCKYFTLGK
jgi:Ca2+-transporting ATPase